MNSSHCFITFLYILFASSHCLITRKSVDKHLSNSSIDNLIITHQNDLIDRIDLSKQVSFDNTNRSSIIHKREINELTTDLESNTNSTDQIDIKNQDFNQTISDYQTTNQTANEIINSNQLSTDHESPLHNEIEKNESKILYGQALDLPDENQTTTFSHDTPIQVNATQPDQTNNSTLNDDELNQFEPFFEIGSNQYLIDGHSNIMNDENRTILIEQFVSKLAADQKVSATINLTCLRETCDQRIMWISVDRIVLKYELIRQNIFLDKSSKFYEYLNCFLIQYNPNFGLKGYFRNGFSFNFKKAFINTCMKNNSIVGSIYLTDEFSLFIKQKNLTTNVLLINYNKQKNVYELKLDIENDFQRSENNAVIANLKSINPTFRPDIDTNLANNGCADEENSYFFAFDKILKANMTKNDKISYMNHLNLSLFKNGLHQQPNKLKYIKAHIIFDTGLLKKTKKESYKILNHLFQVIYESQNHFKQLNMYLVVVRLSFRLPNDLNIYSSTHLKINAVELFEKLQNSNDQTYFDLPADFKILFTSFRIYYENSSYLIPSFSSDNLIGDANSMIAIQFDHLQKNHWLLTYEIAHLFGIRDDDESCSCISDQCVMKRSSKVNELTWSQCSIRQLDENLNIYKFDLSLPVEKTEFNTDFFNRSVCGNGVLELGEQCDCGKFGCFFFDQKNQTYLQNNCCNSTICKIADPSFKCALGTCCDLSTCSLHEPNRICRPSKDVCDIEEKCDGISPFCMEDDYYVNGEFCGMNSICMEKRCINSKIEFNCQNVLGENAFESPICWKKNMEADELYNCGYSFTDRRWISCRSIYQARCGSFQCAVSKNSTNSKQLKRLGKSFDLIKTGTDVNQTHECVLLVIRQNRHNSTRSIPFYAPDGTMCSEKDDSLANLKFCSNGECKSNQKFDDYANCYDKANCNEEERCTWSDRCRCESSAKLEKFDFQSAYYCPRRRSFSRNHLNHKHGLFDRVNFYHLLIIPCFGVVLALASFLRSYLRTGVYRVNNDSSDEMSVSFSGPRPSPFWAKPKK